MNLNFLSNISVADLLVVPIVLLLFVIVILVVLLRSNKKLRNLTYPVYDYIVREAQVKADAITAGATESSKSVLKQVESTGQDIIALEKEESEKIRQAYEEKLLELSEQTKRLLDTYAMDAEQHFLSLTKSLEDTISRNLEHNERFMQDKTVQLSEHLASTFTTLEANVKEQIRSGVEQEFAVVKRIVESYRQKRFALVDSHIVSLIEQTSAIVLQKKLSLDDHAEFVFKALEEAKSKGIFS